MSDGVEFEPAKLEELPTEEAVKSVIDQAVEMGASDLYIVPDEGRVTIGVRHLGIVRNLSSVPIPSGKRIMSSIKVQSGMSIDESRRPLEGRWIRTHPDGRKVDLRINTIPTLYGEDFTIRLLVRDSELQHLRGIGLETRQLNTTLAMLNSPGGLILVTGPTSSGKTTTLYACLDVLNDGTRKINTIEDPIEYAMAGVRQSQVHTRIGVDFPDLLRSVLRQAPDVIMVGEVRDTVTAQTAVRAANSGHLVLVTLHASTAASAVHSMLALGVHPYFLSNSMVGAVAQRLVRTLCPKCKTEFDLEGTDTFKDITPLMEEGQSAGLYSAPGCAECGHEGYTSRTGVFEVMPVSRSLRNGIADARPAKELYDLALEEDMLDFRRAGLLKVARGDTSTEEMLRVVPAQFLGVEEADDVIAPDV